MKRQKKIKGIKVPDLVKDAGARIMKSAITLLTIAILCVTIVLLAQAFVYSSDYFQVKTIETRGYGLDIKVVSAANTQLVNINRGKNVFKLDLKNIAQYVEVFYPDARDIAVRIIPPDRLIVNVQMREAAAYIKDSKYYPVDEEGVMLSAPQQSPASALPIVEGVSIRYEEKKRRRVVSFNLRCAMDLLREAKKQKFMRDYGVDVINAKDPENLSFTLKNGIIVKIGPENFEKRLELLGNTLRDRRLVLDKVKYVDVRFKDVYIGPKSE